jgi:hypothetical protein
LAAHGHVAVAVHVNDHVNDHICDHIDGGV